MSVPANLFVTPFFARGGSVNVTQNEVCFEPNALEKRILKGGDLAISRKDIAAVTIGKMRWWMPRKQLVIRTVTDKEYYFLVSDPGSLRKIIETPEAVQD